jgi:hypothetical protein
MIIRYRGQQCDIKSWVRWTLFPVILVAMVLADYFERHPEK